MIKITDKSSCCGCTACMHVCPSNAITMQPDGMGFLYPVVDEARCIDCSLCERVCAFRPNYEKTDNWSLPEVYAVRHKKMEEMVTSRSGAVFIALSDWILDRGGVIYGAGYADHFRVVHKRAATREQRDEFKGSKYVQSDLRDVFLQVKADLKQGLPVMFSGTPCQVAGLLSWLNVSKVPTDHLWLVDLVCHGVPAPYLWRDYLAYVERRQGERALAVDFRDKTRLGWAAHQESFLFGSGKVIKDTYSDLFGQCIMFRHSCGVCHFANLQRPSDLTIGDFWGWEKVNSTFNSDDRGVSLLLVNSDKGKRLFDLIKSQVNYIHTTIESALQPNLRQPSSIHPQRNQFEMDFIRKGFAYVGRKYGNMGFRTRSWRMLRRIKHFLVRL